MKGPQVLFEYEDHWETNMGAWFPGERVVLRGKDLFTDLKELRWMALLLYGITGRLPDEKVVRLFEGFWALATSFPDPRLWNNRIAALAGTARSTAALGIGAATAISEATLYGLRPNVRAFNFLVRAKSKLDEGADLTELVRLELQTRRKMGGYGRPITQKDERIEPVMLLAKELGLDNGPHIKIAFAIEEIFIKEGKNMRMNIAAVQSALVADLGFSCREYYLFRVLSFSAGMFPCYIDALVKPEGCFFPMRCDRIQYEGTKRRTWEDK